MSLTQLESYDSLSKAMGLLKLLQLGEKDILEGRVMSQGAVFAKMEKKFDL